MSTQSIIIPYHKDKEMIRYSVKLVVETIPPDVEIVVIGNNYNESELDLSFSYRNVRYYRISQNLFYPKAINYGVDVSHGDIITLLDPDVFVNPGWYEPLLKLICRDDIGAVGCKLINPSSGRIIDFGIAHTRFNAIHPLIGEKPDYPLASSNRLVQSMCSAVLMTKKSLFDSVGGMNEDLPYSYTDIEYCLKLRELGYNTIACAESEVYHKGFTDDKNSKYYSFAYLNADSKGLFYGNWYKKFDEDFREWMQTSYEFFINQHPKLSRKIFLLDLSTVYNRKDYYDVISSFGFKTLDKHVVTIGVRDCTHISLHQVVPFHLIETPAPILYFVDLFLCLADNDLWFKHRDISSDMVIDRHGNIHMLTELREHMC